MISGLQSLMYPHKGFERSFAFNSPDVAVIDSVDERTGRSNILMFRNR